MKGRSLPPGLGTLRTSLIFSYSVSNHLTLTLSRFFNHSTDEEFLYFLREYFFPGATSEEVAQILALYPNDPAQGSPFGTGDANQLAPMFKRMAAFEGDFLFQSTRRTLLTLRSDKQPAWTYSAWMSSLSQDALCPDAYPFFFSPVVERNRFQGVGYVRHLLTLHHFTQTIAVDH